MLTAEGCRARRRRLFERLGDRCDVVLLFDPRNLMYFASYYQSPFVFRSANAAAALILGADGSSVLVCDNLVRAFAERGHVDEIHSFDWYLGRASAPERKSLLADKALARLKEFRGKRHGYEAASLPAGILDELRGSAPSAEWQAIDHELHEIKRSKDPDEIELLKRSIHAADAAFDGALRDARPGMTEFDLYLLVQRAAEQHLGEAATVYGDFASGPRCAEGGGPPTTRVIQPGDLVLLDFSVIVEGYRGDCANTFVCGAKPSEEQRRLYEACLAAMAAGEQLLRAGRSCREIDQAVRASLATRGLAEKFTSHAGHGLGLGHPDPPYIVPESTDTLVAGDVVTLEPGVYIAGQAGMRYERNYLITASGYETLSRLTLAIDQP